jgi:hypothetical protein
VNNIDLYDSIRQEIISNHVLMHWFTIIVVLTFLAGVFIVEKRDSILSIFLPLLSIAWAAGMVRFDFFIHRQNAYLRFLEKQLQDQGSNIQFWESWKGSLQSTKFVVPIADVFAFLIIAVPTYYLLFGPAKQYFVLKGWSGHKPYAWSVSLILVFLLISLAIIPILASW